LYDPPLLPAPPAGNLADELIQMEHQYNQQENMKRIARLKRLERILILAFVLVCALLTYFLTTG
jgi:hypothetical protein